MGDSLKDRVLKLYNEMRKNDGQGESNLSRQIIALCEILEKEGEEDDGYGENDTRPGDV